MVEDPNAHVASDAAPGWYPDVTVRDGLRWWDGANWTSQVVVPIRKPRGRAFAIAAGVWAVVGTVLLFVTFFAVFRDPGRGEDMVKPPSWTGTVLGFGLDAFALALVCLMVGVIVRIVGRRG